MSRINLHRMAVVMLATLTCICIATQTVCAQTFSVIYSFPGGSLGARPYAGVTIDRAGNLYGTTLAGGRASCNPDGIAGCGTVYKLTQKNSQWVFGQLYSFAGGTDGAVPYLSRVVVGPNGSLYGATIAGGGGECQEEFGVPGCGTVFNLQPPQSACTAVSCPWHETQLYVFQGSANGGHDGASPVADPIFDQSGNIYGVTFGGGSEISGTAYELSPSNGGWTENILWSFSPTQATPAGTMVFDSAGNLYGTSYGDPATGAVWELTLCLTTIQNAPGAVHTQEFAGIRT